MLEEAVSKAIPQNQGVQTYTKEQLIHIKNASDNPQDKAWAELELEKQRSKEVKELFEKTRTEERREQTLEHDKQAALQEVFVKYPLAFNANGTWNNAHPLTQRMSQIYNSDKQLQAHGRGLSAAADIAFAEWIRTQQPQVVARTTKLKREVTKLQTQTLIEGSGQQTTTVPSTKYSVAM